MAVNDGAVLQKGVIWRSAQDMQTVLNEYGQDLHNEEKTEYDFASELKTKCRNIQNQKKNG